MVDVFGLFSRLATFPMSPFISSSVEELSLSGLSDKSIFTRGRAFLSNEWLKYLKYFIVNI